MEEDAGKVEIGSVQPDSAADPEPTGLKGGLGGRLHRRRESQFDVLAASELPSQEAPGLPIIQEEVEATASSLRKRLSHNLLGRLSLDHHDFFWTRMTDAKESMERDPFFDYSESDDTASGRGEFPVPSLKDCKLYLQNPEAEAYHLRKARFCHRLVNAIVNYLAAIFIYLSTTVTLESLLVLINAAAATTFFCENAEDYAVKLDFSFLAFAVVFPLTFLVQSTFARRDLALSKLADLKACVMSTSLLTFTVDWPDANGNPTGGRLALPSNFNYNVAQDYRDFVVLVYQYLSMPNVGHARYVVIWSKQKAAKRVHALQNNIVKRINAIGFDLSMHTEEMHKYGFPAGEASRLHQYHQYLQQRFEQVRMLKYYHTPMATRSFGRAYLIMLPWLAGPYFAWVYESTGYAFTITLACFTFLIVLGLINAVQSMEDPFLVDYTSWTPGVDTVKLDYEMATLLQSIAQYYSYARVRTNWMKSTGKPK